MPLFLVCLLLLTGTVEEVVFVDLLLLLGAYDADLVVVTTQFPLRVANGMDV
jgi:hypothetical protein